MSAEADVELDAETIAELRPACGWAAVLVSNGAVVERCAAPAQFVMRTRVHCCGRRFIMLRCQPHVAYQMAEVSGYCGACASGGTPFSILSVEPISAA